MPFCSENRRFRDLTHSLTLVAVPDPPPALGVSFVFFIWQMSKYGLKNARERKVGLKKTCVFDSTAFFGGPGSRSRGERRGVLVRGLAPRVFKDTRIWQLICVFHVRDQRR